MSKISESINSSEHIVFRNMEINTKSSKKKKKKERQKEKRSANGYLWAWIGGKENYFLL